MNRCVAPLLAVLILLAAAAVGSANVAPPAPPNPPAPAPIAPVAPVVILLDDTIKEPTLEVPRKLLMTLRASAADGADDGSRRGEASPAWHTILGGVALSSALALGGLWRVRSRARPGVKTVALLLAALGLLAAGTSVLWADIPPFGRGRPVPIPPPPVNVIPGPPGVTLSEKVTIKVVDTGDAIRLIVPRAALARVVESASPTSPSPGKAPADSAPKK
jgi:hypothetical protein